MLSTIFKWGVEREASDQVILESLVVAASEGMEARSIEFCGPGSFGNCNYISEGVGVVADQEDSLKKSLKSEELAIRVPWCRVSAPLPGYTRGRAELEPSGFCLVFVWFLSGIFCFLSGIFWFLSGFCLVFVWFLSGICLVFVWFLSGIFCVLIWFLSCFRLVFV